MEKVLVIPTDIISPYLGNNSFIIENVDEIVNLIKKNYLYVNRTYAEHAKEYKQIIPYVVLIHNAEIFLTQRLKAQTEKRLHGMFSIGLGGHINPSEATKKDFILEGMRRELYEEVGLNNVTDEKLVGIINDQSAEVSNYHIGLVYIMYVSEAINVRETKKMIGQWITPNKMHLYYNCMESWSQIVWDARKRWYSGKE